MNNTNAIETARFRPTHDAATDERIAAFVAEQIRAIQRKNARVLKKLTAEGISLGRAMTWGNRRIRALAESYTDDPRAVAESMARIYGHQFRTLVEVK